MSVIKSKTLPMVIVFISGLIVTIAYFINLPPINQISDLIQTWAVIIAGFALGLGVINMTSYYWRQVSRRVEGTWIYSLIFLVFFAAQAITGLMDIQNLSNPVYVWLYTNIFSSLSAAMYAILGFFILSAGYRAMRARNIESAFILVAGIIVMLMNAPIGAVIWSGFPGLGKWIMDVPSAAVNRAVLIGVGIGSIIIGIRILLGYDRSYLGVAKE